MFWSFLFVTKCMGGTRIFLNVLKFSICYISSASSCFDVCMLAWDFTYDRCNGRCDSSSAVFQCSKPSYFTKDTEHGYFLMFDFRLSYCFYYIILYYYFLFFTTCSNVPSFFEWFPWVLNWTTLHKRYSWVSNSWNPSPPLISLEHWNNIM